MVCMVSAGSKPSWTAKLASNQGLLCSKIREEAGELCETLEKEEGQERAASEMADLLYHSMVLLHVQVCHLSCLYSGDSTRFSTCTLCDLHASLIPLNRPFQAFGVSYEAHRNLGSLRTPLEQRSAAQHGCYLMMLPYISRPLLLHACVPWMFS